MLMDLYISNWLLKPHYFKGRPASVVQRPALQELVALPNRDDAVCALLLDLYLFP